MAVRERVPSFQRLVGLVVKSSASRVKDPGFKSPLVPWEFLGFWIESYGRFKNCVVFQWLPVRVPDVIGSGVGLVGSVSVYCDWVR